MALNVTFTTYAQPALIEYGASATTETIAVGGTSTQGSNAATADQPVASILADEACWIAVGVNPTVVAGSGRKVAAGERIQLMCGPGHKIAAITA